KKTIQRFFSFSKGALDMPTYTTTNDKVQYYLTYSSKRASKHRKIQRMNSISKSLETIGVYLDELFQRKSIRVLDEIAYLTTICGVIKIGAEKLAELVLLQSFKSTIK
ncbi:TPA: hypothetical protein ACQZ2O_002867, partial [Listeria monocytogenes]|nr:hypothetical protein [Listeria monocytogenes]EAC2940742.1 hypothetical protein [Listeria monocytogenes]EAC5911179.1 hypothetical protein [Listeria monocytogenes]EAC7203519.1 hypothetical protein [Listeria monocytogenes]EAC7339281.1 hypothetical protein [Listeria monocytogenes]